MASRRVQWTDTARHDLTGLLRELEPGLAKAELARIKILGAELEQGAREGRIVPELRDAGMLHVKELRAVPWRLIFRVEGDLAFVLAVLDERRPLEDSLLMRLVRL